MKKVFFICLGALVTVIFEYLTLTWIIQAKQGGGDIAWLILFAMYNALFLITLLVLFIFKKKQIVGLLFVGLILGDAFGFYFYMKEVNRVNNIDINKVKFTTIPYDSLKEN